MDENQKYYIPKYLDEPMRIILWTIDEVLAFIIPVFLIYVLSNQLLFGILLGLINFLLLKKLKGEQGAYFLRALIYWHLPQIIKLRKTPPSFIREYIG